MKAPKDFLCGILLAVFGGSYYWLALSYSVGTASRMGPGYFPRYLGLILVALGCIMIVRSYVVAGPRIEVASLRPFAIVSLSIVLFGLLLRPAGLVIAVMVLVAVGSAAADGYRWRNVAVLSAGLAFFSTIVFTQVLGLAIPIWPQL